jgi:DNA-binding transcriptional MerR regulator
MKIGELAKQTGLSIRTLHYYDEIGLLSPSHRTEVGHRLYSDQDIIRLQQILSLRQLGFSLHEIRECLENPDFSLPKVIDLHRARIREQMALSRTLLKRLNGIATELETTRSVAVEHLIEVMETITMSEQYFTPEQQTVLEARFKETEAQWQEMLGLARDVISQDTNLSSVKVQALAKYWQQIMKSLISGDVEMYESLTKLYQQEGAEAASWGTMDAATFEFILKAVAFVSLTDDIGLHLSERNYTSDALQLIGLGQEAVRELNLDVFGTEAMLLGLLAEGKSVAAQVLTAASVNFEAARHQIVQLLGSRPAPPVEIPTPHQLPFAPRAKRVLELAREQAEQLEQSRIAPEHLLLGILAEDEETPAKYTGVAIRILKERFGLDLAHLEQQLRSAMLQ